MKNILILLIGVVLFSFSLLAGCYSANPNKAKASLLLNEINEIAEKSKQNMLAEDIMSKIKRVEENRKNFPDSREEIKKDAESVKAFFVKVIEDDKRIIQKSEELLKSGLVNSEADCVNYVIKSLNIGIEQKETVLTQYALFFDETIKDKETLESKTFSIREKIKVLDKKNAEIKSWEERQCPVKTK